MGNIAGQRRLLNSSQHPDGSFALSLPGQELAVLAEREIDTIKSLPETEVSIKYDLLG